MPNPTLTADEAAAIALERYGDGWIALGPPDRWLSWQWWWYETEYSAKHGGGNCYYIGPGHPNPDHWRETCQRIERKRDA